MSDTAPYPSLRRRWECALQGLGGGGLIVNVMALSRGDLVSTRERGRYQGTMGAVMALAMIVGPLAGRFITDNLSWRWAFYVNLPVVSVLVGLQITNTGGNTWALSGR